MLAHNALHHRIEVGHVVREIVDVPLARIGEGPVRSALTSPVEGHDGETAPSQLGDDLEILLDELRAALHEHDGAARTARRRPPARHAQMEAACALDPREDGLRWRRRGRERNEFHGANRRESGQASQ